MKQVVSNNYNNCSQYYYAFFILLAVIIIFNYLCYYHLLQVQREKQKVFIEGSSNSISNMLVNDLKLIFDQSQDLKKLSLLRNYEQIKKLGQNYNIIGNVIYVNRGNKAVIFDLQPIMSLISSILGGDFYYKITLNNNILFANIGNEDFLYIKNYPIDMRNFLNIGLTYKPTSFYLESGCVFLSV